MGERRLLGALAGVLGCAAVPAALGLAGHPVRAFHVGLVLVGLLAVGSGLGVVAWWAAVRRHRPVEVSRLLLGLAVVCWGTGQLVNAVDALIGDYPYPSLGDSVCVGAAPLAVLAVAMLPRRSAGPGPGLRMGLDALLLGSAVTLLIWRFVITTPDGPRGATVGNAVFVLCDALGLAALLLLAVRDARSRIWPTALGFAGHLVADVLVLQAGNRDAVRVDPWLATSIWCVAWPLIALGFVLFRRSPPSASEGAEDRHEAQAGQVATLLTGAALVVVAGAGVVANGAVDPRRAGTFAFVLLIVLLVVAREVLGTSQRLGLTAGLRAEVFRDSLTGMPNRRALTGRLADLEATGLPWVVLTLDIKGFKQVNDLLGSQAGDELLIHLGRALVEGRPDGAFVARIGGDEFAVLAPGDVEQGRQLAERLRPALAHAVSLRAPGLGTSVSMGVGRLQRSGLVESAAALRVAKESGAIEVYDGAVAAARERRLTLELRLRRAIEEGAIHTVGQPIVDLATGRVGGFESLARWTDAELGPVSPAEFIEVAEEGGLVVALGEQLLRSTVADATRAGVFAAGLTVSVNVSPIQLRVPGFVDVLKGELARHGVPPSGIVVEITEAILVTEGDPALHALAELNLLGVALAIDDFGTGYSALGYLRRPPDQRAEDRQVAHEQPADRAQDRRHRRGCRPDGAPDGHLGDDGGHRGGGRGRPLPRDGGRPRAGLAVRPARPVVGSSEPDSAAAG